MKLLRLSRSKAALAIKTATIVFAMFFIYNQDLAIIANEAMNSEMMSHILAVPFLFVYLIYRKRNVIRGAITVETSSPKRKAFQTREVGGAFVCLVGFLLYWYGSYTFTPLEYHIVSLPIFAAGLVLLIFNSETLRSLAFPIGFLMFLTPPPLEAFYAAGTILSIYSSRIAYTLLDGVGLPVILSMEYGPPVITLDLQSGPMPFAVDLACSGMYSVTGFTIFSIFVAYISRGKPWKKAIIFVIGFPLIYLLNVARIVSLVLIGYTQGAEAAMQAFHLLGGLTLTFLGTIVLLLLSERAFKLQIFISKDINSCRRCETITKEKDEFCLWCGRLLKNKPAKISRKDMAKILLLVTFILSAVFAQVPVFALTKGPAETVLETPGGWEKSANILPEIPGYSLGFVSRDRRFEKITGQDASLVYSYYPLERTEQKLPIFVALEIGSSRLMLHRWEYCLITGREIEGYPPTVTPLDQRDVDLVENPPMIGRFLAVQWIATGTLEVILYWYENTIFRTNSTYQNKHVKMSVIAFSNSPEEYREIEETLLPFGEAIANYWQPIKTWSRFSLDISRNGPYLIGASVTSLIVFAALEAIRNINRKKKNVRIYEKLVPDEKLTIKAVSQASKGPATLKNIAAQVEVLTGKQIDLKVLLRRLIEAQEAGLLRRDLANVGDEPILVWKSLVSI